MRKKNLKNKMIILCGGKGKRMGNVTKNIAKPMVKIGKHAIIKWLAPPVGLKPPNKNA